MLLIPGGPALRTFQLQQRLQYFPEGRVVADAITTRFVYFVDADTALDTLAMQRLTAVLMASDEAESSDEPLGLPRFWVVPRCGTTSPWSSKATDIARRAGLTSIQRIERGIAYYFSHEQADEAFRPALFDPLTESLLTSETACLALFASVPPPAEQQLDIVSSGLSGLATLNETMGLALSQDEQTHLLAHYTRVGRNPTVAELMMFAQVNSEHCRHKIFNAEWTLDGQAQSATLFSMIKHTYASAPTRVRVAYSDNAAVLASAVGHLVEIDPRSQEYTECFVPAPIVLKVETHNHPTAISPFAGAATGSGGEIRDEGATGRGARPKAGMCGFSVSDLRIPQLPRPWETVDLSPPHLASSLEIMLQAPIGAAAFNNEFGRPNVTGYFRVFSLPDEVAKRSYHIGYAKPVMIAGGIGRIREELTNKQPLPAGTALVVLGGPGFAIGLGGGSASSRATSVANQALDFASVQRANPEMQRRCQSVISACCARVEASPILSIHDVGAGGLSNAVPEIVHDAGKGAIIDFAAIPVADASLTPMQVWCNESQERYVLAVARDQLDEFSACAERERCPYAVIGEVTDEPVLIVEHRQQKTRYIDLPLAALFEQMPALSMTAHSEPIQSAPFNDADLSIATAIQRVLQHPTVASKQFLITIGDRTVGGVTVRDQMVGPWQVPVADCAVTASGFSGAHGEALAVGERAPIAVLDAAASARMAIGEAITNIAAADVEAIEHISMSANWMACPQAAGQAAALYQAVAAVGLAFCPALGIAIPVGKDSLSMQALWQNEDGGQAQVVSPVTLVASAAAPVGDITRSLTPQLRADVPSELLLIDLGDQVTALGGSILAEVTQQLGGTVPDCHDPDRLKRFFAAMVALRARGLLLAYHDRSDGGLLATVVEMMFAGHCGVTLDLTAFARESLAALFNEQLGAVVQYHQDQAGAVADVLAQHGLIDHAHVIAHVNTEDALVIQSGAEALYRESRVVLHAMWQETSFSLQSLRDNPDCANQEHEGILDQADPGLSVRAVGICSENNAPYISVTQPRVAILREQGVNGHMEMAAAFMQAGFQPVDVHMSDLVAGQSLDAFVGMAVCGGFSYGDVVGAGRGWAQVILQQTQLRDAFQAFFQRENTFTFGVCNGCQMLSHLHELIPGTTAWPRFLPNRSEQFEARLVLAEVVESPAVLLAGMAGVVAPVVVSHGEGRAQWSVSAHKPAPVALRYVDHYQRATERYPFNPNGSPEGLAGVCSADGRVLLTMPHPERVFRVEQFSWLPPEIEVSPWAHLFGNAARFVG